MTDRQYFCIMAYATEIVVWAGKCHATMCAHLEPGTVWGSGITDVHAANDARVKARNYQRSDDFRQRFPDWTEKMRVKPLPAGIGLATPARRPADLHCA